MVHIAAQDERRDYVAAPLDAGGMDERHKADKLMADFAAAFSLEMDFEQAAETERKWPARLTIAFATAAGLTLWGILAGLFYLL